jgi:hypothetical protein
MKLTLTFRIFLIHLFLIIAVDDTTASTKKQVISSKLSQEYFKDLDTRQNAYAIPRSCAEALSIDPSLPTGVYKIDPDGMIIGDSPIDVYCNMETGIFKSIM